MLWRRHAVGVAFTCVFVGSYFTNKYILSVLKFTFPTLLQGWQTFLGVLLLFLFGKCGWVELSRVPRSVAVSWLPGSLLFLGNIYGGSRALSHMDVPMFFALHNTSQVVTVLLQLLQRQKVQCLRLFSACVLLASAINLQLLDAQLEPSAALWATLHLTCVGVYRVFQSHFKPSHLSDLEQQYLNSLFSVLLLLPAAQPTGDLQGAQTHPALLSPRFHWSCGASGVLGFLLLLLQSRLRNTLPPEQWGAWGWLSRVLASCLSPLLFQQDFSPVGLACVFLSHVADGLLVYSERGTPST